MSKSVLILDTPKMCDDCLFYRCAYDENDDYLDVCMALRETIDDCYEKRYDGCPLKEVPKKKEGEVYFLEDAGFQNGWNECLDEILGEKEN